MPVTRSSAGKTATKTSKTASVKAEAKKAVAPAPQRAAKSTTAKPKTAAAQSTASARRTAPPAIDPEKRRHYVEVAAYYIAERRGFVNGDETRDWLAAEEEIDRLLREKKLSA
jgi:hypothetical protein